MHIIHDLVDLRNAQGRAIQIALASLDVNHLDSRICRKQLPHFGKGIAVENVKLLVDNAVVGKGAVPIGGMVNADHAL